MHGTRRKAIAALTAAVVVLAMLAAGAQARPEATGSTAATIQIGIIYSRTGLLGAYGAEYLSGLRLGLNYATGGTNRVNGNDVEFTLVDDGGDPAKAVTAAKDLIGKGYKILGGTVSSGIALQLAPLADQNKILYISGPAASDAITGINDYTFRSGRQTYQDVKASTAYLKGAVGKNVVVFAQDSAFGAGNFAAVRTIFGDLSGQKVDRVLVPLSAQDFTPYAQQLRQKNPDLVFVAWAGTTTGAMWNALDQQGVFNSVDTIVTGLAERATWPFYGPATGKIKFLNHYNAGAPKNTVNDWLVAKMKRRSQAPDLFTPDGFVAAQMMVRALKASATDVSKMVSSLEGWSFTGPKGQQEIRASDHAMLQPMFLVQLRQNGTKYTANTTVRLRAKHTAPPAK
ncbi:MAG: amino acid transporter substrate-binding protein [Thermoleophilia bacterium]|jgi:branched-chain amino acid transport system substrate-binding protein|nr:amino acid transporter substrate-binding protein [Thermoleophilia bacterium]